jgi:hypothetical protein
VVHNAEERTQKRPTPAKIPDVSAQEPQITAKIPDTAEASMEGVTTGLIAGQVTANAASGAHTNGEKAKQGPASVNSNDADSGDMMLASADDKAAIAATIQEMAKSESASKRKLSTSTSTGAEVVDEDSSGGKEGEDEKKNEKEKA